MDEGATEGVRIQSGDPYNPALKTGRFRSPELINSVLAGSNPWWAFEADNAASVYFQITDHPVPFPSSRCTRDCHQRFSVRHSREAFAQADYLGGRNATFSMEMFIARAIFSAAQPSAIRVSSRAH